MPCYNPVIALLGLGEGPPGVVFYLDFTLGPFLNFFTLGLCQFALDVRRREKVAVSKLYGLGLSFVCTYGHKGDPYRCNQEKQKDFLLHRGTLLANSKTKISKEIDTTN